MIESVKESKGKEMSEVMCWNRRSYVGSFLTKLKKLQEKKNGYSLGHVKLIIRSWSLILSQNQNPESVYYLLFS